MILSVKPAQSLKGRVNVTASKSYSIRAFIIASCGGVSRIINPSDSDDVRVSIATVKALGAVVTRSKNNVWQVKAKPKKGKFKKINVKESGTVLRFLLPLLPQNFETALVVGEGTLKGRPNAHLTKTLRKMGMTIKGSGRNESIPINFKGGDLRPGNVTITGTLSSQFISALLIGCPRLNKNTTLMIQGKKVVSQDYVTMTQQVLIKSGVTTKKISPRKFKIPGNQKFKGLKRFNVPSDYGLAAFLMAAGALTKSDITLKGNFDHRFLQADGAIIPFLRKMGVKIKTSPQALKIQGPFKLKGGSFSLKNAPDLVPIMATLALFAQGKTRLYDVAHVRGKESDRITDLKNELKKVGAKVKEKSNEMTIIPQKKYKANIVLNPHRDHRLAMSFCVLGLKTGVKVRDIECVSKSYPKFVRDLKIVGAKVRNAK